MAGKKVACALLKGRAWARGLGVGMPEETAQCGVGGRSQGGRQSGRNGPARPQLLRTQPGELGRVSVFSQPGQGSAPEGPIPGWAGPVRTRCGGERLWAGVECGTQVLGDPPRGLPRVSSCGLGQPVTWAALFQIGPSDQCGGGAWTSSLLGLPLSRVGLGGAQDSGFNRLPAAEGSPGLSRWGPGSLGLGPLSALPCPGDCRAGWDGLHLTSAPPR